MSNLSQINIHRSKFLNGKNYRIWYDSFKTLIGLMDLEEYLTKDVVGDIKKERPNDEKAIKEAKRNNAKVRLMLINTLTPKVHEEIIGIDTVSVIIETLKTEYDDNNDDNDLTLWINKLLSIKAKNENDIPKVCKKIIKIFDIMSKAKKNMNEKEKVKYFLHALPESYKRKIMLTSDTTVTILYEKIKKDPKFRNYYNNICY